MTSQKVRCNKVQAKKNDDNSSKNDDDVYDVIGSHRLRSRKQLRGPVRFTL